MLEWEHGACCCCPIGAKGGSLRVNRVAIALLQEAIANSCKRWQVTELALFGSVLRDDFRPDSNIDAMVQFHPESHSPS